MKLELPRAHGQGLFQHHRSASQAPNWPVYVITRVKAVRSVVFNGHSACTSSRIQFPCAVGLIELTGTRIGLQCPELLIGFSASADLPAPTFTVAEDEAVGTMVLPVSYLAPFLHMAHSPGAHIRVGGNGVRNALGADATVLSERDGF